MLQPHRMAFVLSLFPILFVLGASANAQFETRGSSPAERFPFSAAVGDFNHDGKLDLAVASLNSSTGFATDIQVLLGNGDGTFQPAVDYAVGSSPSSVAAADLNHDGNLDLVVANGQSDSISVLLGNGDGTFLPAQTFANPPGLFFVAVGDFNGDGNLDIATLNQSDSTGRCDCVAIFLGNGDGTFQQPPITTTPSLTPEAIGTGQFTRGKPLGIAVAEEFGQTSQVEILLGNGDGTFRFGEVYQVGASPTSIAVADFNGDGKADLAVAETEGVGVGVLLGNGDGTFGPRVDYPAYGPLWVTTADLNGDGTPDIVGANIAFPSGVTVLMGNGDGEFDPVAYYPDGRENRFVTTGDFNGDHKTDIVVLDYRNGTVDMMLNTGVVTFSPTTPLNFKKQKHGTTSPPQTVTLTNTGKTRLKISTMKATGEFAMTSTCGESVAAGASCTIRVNFSPRTQGAKSGTITINDSASSKPQVIVLSGTGT